MKKDIETFSMIRPPMLYPKYENILHPTNKSGMNKMSYLASFIFGQALADGAVERICLPANKNRKSYQFT